MFPRHFTVTARSGLTRTRHIGDSVADCLAWAASMRDQGWSVSEPVPWEQDNVIGLRSSHPSGAAVRESKGKG